MVVNILPCFTHICLYRPASPAEELVIDSERHVFLDVYADWCGPCLQVGIFWIPSGNLTVGYWKWPFIVSFPMNSMVIFHSYVNVYQRVTRRYIWWQRTKKSQRATPFRQSHIFTSWWEAQGSVTGVLRYVGWLLVVSTAKREQNLVDVESHWITMILGGIDAVLVTSADESLYLYI